MVEAYKRKQQKRRSFKSFKFPKFKFGHSSIYSMSSGFLSSKILENFGIRFKKFIKLNKSVIKIWFFLPLNYIVTKKSLNVRMGKGKGARKGLLSLIKPGTNIIELKYCRLGILLKLYRYIRVRCQFSVGFINFSTYNIFLSNSYILKSNLKIKRRRRIRTRWCIESKIQEARRIYEKSSNLRRINQFNFLYDRFWEESCLRGSRLRYNKSLTFLYNYLWNLDKPYAIFFDTLNKNLKLYTEIFEYEYDDYNNYLHDDEDPFFELDD